MIDENHKFSSKSSSLINSPKNFKKDKEELFSSSLGKKKTPFWEEACKEKILEPTDLFARLEKWRKEGKKIVTLNGSFDLLHAGHLQIIYEASTLGDILIVALNSDASIKQYKSIKRPIIPLKYRMQMMAALGFVDYVTYFEEVNPILFLSHVQPNIHVNGPEYGENCVESDEVKKHGGKIHIAKFVEGLSTSKIIEKIKRCD